jgi:hypothetical protein
MVRTVVFVLLFVLALRIPGDAQQTSSQVAETSATQQPASDMPDMQMNHGSMQMTADSLTDLIVQHSTAGTDAEPDSTPKEMLMTNKGNWMLMLHGIAFLADIQQTGPRGRDKLFSPNWIMPMAQRRLGNGTLTLRTMLSLEPATISQRQYPILFQQGETAFGRPIVDGQHPHDFFMELSAIYDYRVGERTLLSFYFAPVGDPALGPIAYPHRSSAAENPVTVLGHHLQDSTHISDEVVTLGVTHRAFRLEASGFHGREPDEFRWNIDTGKIDSWSTRITVNPGRNWSMQYSIGHLHSPEELQPKEDVRRTTASLMYNREFHNGNLASTLAWGRNQSLQDGNVGNGYLAESTIQFLNKNFAWTRIENVDRTNELLLGENPLPPGFQERYFTRVQAYTVGYDREVGHIPHLATAIGGQFMWYGVPDALKPLYGSRPVGGVVFIRVRAH